MRNRIPRDEPCLPPTRVGDGSDLAKGLAAVHESDGLETYAVRGKPVTDRISMRGKRRSRKSKTNSCAKGSHVISSYSPWWHDDFYGVPVPIIPGKISRSNADPTVDEL